MMYSPADSKLAVVALFPSASTAGRGFANFTLPGPRNLLHEMVMAGWPRPRAASGGRTPSSVAHSVNATGSDTLVFIVAAISVGGPVNDFPAGSNFSTGGVL